MENALNIVKRAIFKEIVEFTLLKRFTIVLFNVVNGVLTAPLVMTVLNFC